MNTNESIEVPPQYARYCVLFMAAMFERTSIVAEFVGANAQFEREFPRDPDDDYEDEY